MKAAVVENVSPNLRRWGRVLSLVLAGLMLVLLSSCGSSDGSQGGDTSAGDNAGGGNNSSENASQQGEGDTSSQQANVENPGQGVWPVVPVADEVSPSVVQVNVSAIENTPFGEAQEQEGLGSGVVYRPNGLIITNNHVVEGADSVNVAFADGTTVDGEVIGTDPSTDLAVVRVSRNNLPAAQFDTGRHEVGELAVAIGSPSGFQATVTSGVVSGLNRQVPAQYTGGRQESALVDLIQTDAAISPGNSGGALVNEDGQVIGINVAYLPPGQTGAENIGFAIPSETATSVADQLIDNGEVTQPYLGIIDPRNMTPQIAEQFGFSVDSGVIVLQVGRGTPAARAGIQERDVITEVGSADIEDTGDLYAALRDYEPGDTVEVTVARDDQTQTVELELGTRPQR